jgi:predicted PurR-regulated permease PerM
MYTIIFIVLVIFKVFFLLRYGRRLIAKIPLRFLKYFTQHPSEMGETYWQHAKFALHISGQCCLVAIQAIVHAFLPFIWTWAASQRLKQIQEEINIRKQKFGKIPS